MHQSSIEILNGPVADYLFNCPLYCFLYVLLQLDHICENAQVPFPVKA